MNNLILDIVSVGPTEVQSSVEVEEKVGDNLGTRVARAAWATIVWLFYAALMLASFIGILVILFIVFLYMTVYLWVYLDAHWPNQQGDRNGNQTSTQQIPQGISPANNGTE